MRPVIGITTYVEQAQWGVWDTPAALLPYGYVRAVEAAGGRPVLLPPMREGIEETLAVVNGLIFAGGADLDPMLYGAPAHPQTSGVRQDRDGGESSLLAAALTQGIPVLGICRGMQLLNAVSGGTLHQHLAEVTDTITHRSGPGIYAEHGVRFEPGSLVCRLLGDRAHVKSYHHQGIDRVAPGLTPTGWADDGTVEVLERTESPFAIGVLWHPEVGEEGGLFAGLVAATRPV